MMKVKQVDVSSSVMWNKENGRKSPADQSEFASIKSNVKVWGCPNCQLRVEKSKVSFGEEVVCSKCGSVMKELGWVSLV